MKVLLVNGSPHKEGCTYTALSEVGAAIEAAGLATELFWIGPGPVRGCAACGKCDSLGRCVFEEDKANALLEAIKAADGVVLGSPVYYAGPNGALCALLDRVFFAGSHLFAGKVGAAVVSCRRGGSTAALDRLNKYFGISGMPVAGSQYWNMVHGHTPDEVRQDAEGLQIMRTLGAHIARLLKATEGLPPPELEPRVMTNFIR